MSDILWDNSLKPKLMKPAGKQGYGNGKGHEAPRNNGYNAPMFKMDAIYPSDVYSPQNIDIYSYDDKPVGRESFAVISKVRRKPESVVTIYRAVPEGVTVINKGDWVTPSLTYAKLHLNNVLEGKGKIIAKKVKAKDLFTDANSLNEFGYDPEEYDE